MPLWPHHMLQCAVVSVITNDLKMYQCRNESLRKQHKIPHCGKKAIPNVNITHFHQNFTTAGGLLVTINEI